jgi:preprotein translocase subunit SecG
MQTYFSVAQIVLSIALVLAILAQVRGGGLGGIFGQPDSVYRSRRGVEKTLYRLTIALVVLFIAISLATLMV